MKWYWYYPLVFLCGAAAQLVFEFEWAKKLVEGLFL